MHSTLNILYLTINENISSKEDGVARKLLSKVRAIKTHAQKCSLLNASANTVHDEIKLLEKNDLFTSIEIGVKKANTGRLNIVNTDRFFYSQLAAYIRENNLAGDRIIFRYPFASLGLKHFTECFSGKIVFEHNTKEIEELKIAIANKKYAGFSVRPSKFLFWLQEKVYPVHYETYLSRKIFQHAHSGSCVTTEIANYERQRTKDYTTFVSSNFYDTSKAALSTSQYKPSTELLKLGIIVTSTAGWYGLERLLRSFAPVQDQYIVMLAGIDANDPFLKNLIATYKINKNIEFTGKINEQQLTAFYNSVHLCFGSLGLYTINLQYASTLKVKESLAFGVPVVVGYKEEDFEAHSEFAPYYLQLKNDSSLIDFKMVKEFAVKFYSNPEHKILLRNLALKYMDVNVKVEALLNRIKS